MAFHLSSTVDIPSISVTQGEHQLSDQDKHLYDAAVKAIELSHSPYSRFKVSSAVLMEDGEIVTGSNQENAAYPSGLCAERVALFAAKAKSHLPIKTILVMAQLESGDSADAFSCGSCRQVMLEYASLQSAPIKILMQTRDRDFIEVKDVKDLLPFNFTFTSL